jgi:phosphatidylserine decarboxylase
MIKDAYRFALPPLIAGLLCFVPGWRTLGVVLILLGLFVFYFFRDPQRVIPTDPRISWSPPRTATIVEIVDEMLESTMGHRITIFLAVWDVHVQRAPGGRKIATWSTARTLLRGDPRRAPPRKRTEHDLYSYATWQIGFQTNRRSHRAPRDMLESARAKKWPRASMWA